ncbi:MAG: hypothetical protein II999_03495 [Bacteroidaceae bacterium]|nr:hypothetical protein [Bacteroidaceae bacterium]
MTEKDYQYWKEMARRYFDAETTEAEERMLKRFAASPETDGAEWDELRAVMGYATVGKRLRRQAASITSIIPFRPRRRWIPAVAAASILLALVSVPTMKWLTADESAEKDICIAYVNGHRVTDPTQVIQAMHHAMSHVQQVKPMTTVEEQLGSMFELMKK